MQPDITRLLSIPNGALYELTYWLIQYRKFPRPGHNIKINHTNITHLTLWWVCIGYDPRWQSSWGQQGAHLGPVGPRWAPCWSHEPCYQGCELPDMEMSKISLCNANVCISSSSASSFSSSSLTENVLSYWKVRSLYRYIHRLFVCSSTTFHALIFFVLFWNGTETPAEKDMIFNYTETSFGHSQSIAMKS